MTAPAAERAGVARPWRGVITEYRYAHAAAGRRPIVTPV